MKPLEVKDMNCKEIRSYLQAVAEQGGFLHPVRKPLNNGVNDSQNSTPYGASLREAVPLGTNISRNFLTEQEYPDTCPTPNGARFSEEVPSGTGHPSPTGHPVWRAVRRERTSSKITSLIENHLAQCQRCRIELQCLEIIEETLSNQPLESTPPELSKLVMKKVTGFEKQRLVSGRIISAVAVILMGVIGYLALKLPLLSIDTIWQESQPVVAQIQSIGNILIEIISAVFYACFDVIRMESINLPDLPSNTTTILLLAVSAILTFGINIILIKEKRRV